MSAVGGVLRHGVRGLSSCARQLSSIAPARKVLVYTGPSTDVDCRGRLFDIFQKQAPSSSVEWVDSEGLQKRARLVNASGGATEKAVLVMPGGRLFEFMTELRDLVPRIRSMIREGRWNYFGSGAGAAFASQGTINALSDLSLRHYCEGAFLGLSNFYIGGFPLRPDTLDKEGGGPIQIREDGGRKYTAYWNAGPILIERGDTEAKVEARFAASQIPKGSASDVAALSGTYGKGKFRVFSYHSEIDTGPDPERQKSFEEAIQSVLH